MAAVEHLLRYRLKPDECPELVEGRDPLRIWRAVRYAAAETLNPDAITIG